MRPLRLTVENFASFKGRQPVLDFSRHDLFAIAGPTGAGKSSLLDAVVFALYGRVPRLGARGLSEIISLGRDRLVVVLDFSSGARTYRVTRVARRGRTNEAQLDELKDGLEHAVCDGVTAVDRKLQDVLGLKYEAFTQAVILPQGQFAEFLKSAPKARREILSDLLRLGVYERMRRRASEEAARLKGELAGHERLAESYADATPEAVEDTRVALAACGERRTAAARDLEVRQGRVETLRARAVAFRERAERRAQAERLRAEEPELARARERLAGARRAAGVLPRLETATAAEARAGEAARRRDEATAHAQAQRAVRDRAERALGDVRREAAVLPELDARLRALDEVAAWLAPRDEARRQRDQAQADLARRGAEREAARQAAAQAAAGAVRLAAERESAEAALRAVDYDAGRHEQLHELRDEAARLETARVTARRAAAVHDEATARAHAADADYARDASAAAESAARLAAAGARREAAEAELRAEERREAAMHLRTDLRPGEPCPVCEQPVAHPPTAQLSLRRTELAEDAARARAAEDDARAKDAAARDAAARADAARQQAQREEERSQRDSREASAAVEELAGALERALDALLPGVAVPPPAAAPRRKTAHGKAGADGAVALAGAPPAAAPEERLRAALDDLSARRTRHAAALAARDHAQQSLDQTRHAAAQAEQQAHLLAERVAELEERARAAAAQARALEERIAAVTRADDPAAERRSLAERRDALQLRLDEAAEAARRGELAEAQAETARHEADKRADEAQREARGARRAARQAAQDAGFADEAAVLDAQLATAEQEPLQERLDAHGRETHAVRQRLEALAAELRGLEFDEAAVSAEEQALAAARTAHEDALREEERLRHRLADLERRAEQAAALAREAVQQRRAFETQRRLADDLRNDGFQAFLLEEAFRELVTGASGRLFELTGRYTFEFKDDAFHVLDHDNARERRSAETLSGGETFLASLALALEMSQQVQRAAGAVHLDSLFIDEGFGTLDPETLETIAAAIESLNVGGRMVGIITHIPELTRRFDVRFEVEKRPEGSRVSVAAG